MKKTLLSLIAFMFFYSSYTQEKLGRPYFTGDINITFGINENYQLGNSEETGPLIVPTALFLRIGLGYEFKEKLGVSFNFGYDDHFNYAVDAFPTYFGLKYNVTNDDENLLFTELRYGKMWTPSSNYSNGNYYGLGLGFEVLGESRWNTIIRIDFHRKGILGFKNNRIDSFSLGIGFSFF